MLLKQQVVVGQAACFAVSLFDFEPKSQNHLNLHYCYAPFFNASLKNSFFIHNKYDVLLLDIRTVTAILTVTVLFYYLLISAGKVA